MTTISNTSPTTASAVSTKTSAASTSTSGSSAGMDVVNLLKQGSGIDVKVLAQNLVNAEKAPRQALIDKAIQTNQAKISGYASIMSAVSSLKDAFAAMQDQSSFNSLMLQNSAPTALSVTGDSTALAGNHQIDVLSLAQPQRSFSAGFSSSSAALNGGNPFTVDISIGGVNTTVDVTTATPAGIVAAINAKNTGVTAQMVNTGAGSNGWTIALNSTSSGSANAFTATVTGFTATDGSGNPVAPPVFSTSQTAADAHLKVDGLEMWRSSNTVSDAIPGLTLGLLAPTSSNGTLASSTPATVQLTRDTSAIQTAVQNLVSAFNNVKSVLKAASDKNSTTPDVGGTLVNDALVRQIRNQVTNMVTGYSPTASGDIKALRDLGVTLQADGTLAVSTKKLDTALSQHYDDVVNMMSANQNTHSTLGLAGNAAQSLTDVLSSTGPIVRASKNASTMVTHYTDQETQLNSQMQSLLDRYTKQFAAMDMIVGQMNSLRTSLTSQFNSMLNVNNKN